jgi:outer membrane protein, heavy metal efflux system
MVGVQNLPISFKFNEDAMTMKMIGISQNIPYAGQKGLERKAAQSDFLTAKEDTRSLISDLATSAKYAYLDLYYRKQALNLVQSQRSIQQDILSSALSRLRTDQATQSDVAAAQADLWRLDADILSRQQDIESAQNDLLALMGRKPESKLSDLSDPQFEIASQPLDTWLAAATENYPPLRKLASQSESFRLSAAASRRMRWPMIGLSGNYGIRGTVLSTDPMNPGLLKLDNMVSFQANISLPIFSGRAQGKMASSMEAMRQSTDSEKSQLQRDIESKIRTLYDRSQRLKQSIDLYQRRIIPADQDAYQSAFSGYTSNRLPFSSLLTYALNIYRDRLTANQIATDLARTLAEAEGYIINPDIWVVK